MKMNPWVVMVCTMLLGMACFAQDGGNPKTSALAKKGESIIIPAINFNDASVADVVGFLTKAARDNDADKTGVNILLMDRENTTKITMSLKNVSLRTALKFVAEMAGLSIGVEDDVVVLRKPKEQKP